MNTRVVFIGDSITDSGRFFDGEGLGTGYVRLIRDLCAARRPDLDFEWINRGVSGDAMWHLKSRWEKDAIQTRPDWLSISIGINDVWNQLDDREPKVSLEMYEDIYRELLDRAARAKLILMEPSLLGEDPASEGNQMLAPYVDCVRRLAGEYAAILVPIHAACLNYLKHRRSPALTVDGVHLAGPGNALFAAEWLRAANFWD